MHMKCMFLVWFEHSAYSYFAFVYKHPLLCLLLFLASCILPAFFCIVAHVTYQEFRQALSLSVLWKMMPVLLLLLLLSAALPSLLLLHHILAIASAVMMLPHQC